MEKKVIILLGVSRKVEESRGRASLSCLKRKKKKVIQVGSVDFRHVAVVYFYLGGCSQNAYSMGRLRTCPRHPRLLKLHSTYNPPLHLIAPLLLPANPWYCFNKRFFRIKSTAFFVYGGWINIFFHSTTPNGSLRCSSFYVSSEFSTFHQNGPTVCEVTSFTLNYLLVCYAYTPANRSDAPALSRTRFMYVASLNK